MCYLFYLNPAQKYIVSIFGPFYWLIYYLELNNIGTGPWNLKIGENSIMHIFICFLHGTSLTDNACILRIRRGNRNKCLTSFIKF